MVSMNEHIQYTVIVASEEINLVWSSQKRRLILCDVVNFDGQISSICLCTETLLLNTVDMQENSFHDVDKESDISFS